MRAAVDCSSHALFGLVSGAVQVRLNLLLATSTWAGIAPCGRNAFPPDYRRLGHICLALGGLLVAIPLQWPVAYDRGGVSMDRQHCAVLQNAGFVWHGAASAVLLPLLSPESTGPFASALIRHMKLESPIVVRAICRLSGLGLWLLGVWGGVANGDLAGAARTSTHTTPRDPQQHFQGPLRQA